MRKIVQLDEYEYSKLADLAKLNEKEIEKRAIDLWKEKGRGRNNNQDRYWKGL